MTAGASGTASSACVGCDRPAPESAYVRLAARLRGLIGKRRNAPAQVARMAIADVLGALPADTPPELRAAIESGCCTYYTVAEGLCGGAGCGSGSCCYHVVSAACGINVYKCLAYPCSHGDFSTGC